MNKKSILAISGSTKGSSSSLSILKFIKRKYQSSIDFKIYNQLAELPHFNPELESNLPQEVIDLRRTIEQADLVLFCTPEYVYSLPGSLKNLIEWNVSTVLFSKKPVGIIVAAASGKKALESLSLILTTIEASLSEDSKLLIPGAKGKLNSQGEIIEEKLIEQIDQLMDALITSLK